LGERGHGDAFRLELLRSLAEAPRVERHLTNVEVVREIADLVDAVDDATVAVEDVATDMKVGVRPDDC
jgi:hypothetical protein